MALFDGLRGSPEKLERKGDEALAARDAMRAIGHYRDARARARKKDPAAADRLDKKIHDAQRLFVRGKIEEADRLIKDEAPDLANECLQIAREQLGAPDTQLSAEIERLEKEAQALLERLSAPDDAEARAARMAAGDISAAIAGTVATPIPAYAQAAAGDGDADSHDETEGSLEVLFEQLAAGLPAEDRERGLELGPAFQEGFIATQQEDLGRAEAAFKQAATEHPEDPLVLEYLARVLDESQRPREAAEKYRAALELAPGRLHTRIALAGILAGVEATGGGRAYAEWQLAARATESESEEALEEALTLLADGLESTPEQAAARFMGAADICLARGKAERALGYITRAMEQGAERDPSAWHTFGVALEIDRKLDEAEEAYHSAVHLGGQSMFFRAEFAGFALRNHQALKKAEELIFETCMGCQATMPSPEVLDTYGLLLTRIQYARGELKPALQGVERLLKKGVPQSMTEPLLRMRREIRERLSVEGAEFRPEPEEDADLPPDDHARGSASP